MLRPEPVRGVRFKGTYREEGWRRCGAASAPDGIVFTPWPHDELPGESLPALEAAKCVARQGAALFERFHLGVFEAFFARSRNIADRAELARLAAAVGADGERFATDLASGVGRQAVIDDYTGAIAEHGVQAIPTVIVAGTDRRLVGLADLATYRDALAAAV